MDSVSVVHVDKAVTTNLSPINFPAMTPGPVSVGTLGHLTEMSRSLPNLCLSKKVFLFLVSERWIVLARLAERGVARFAVMLAFDSILVVSLAILKT